MENIAPPISIEEAPISLAVLDRDLCFINCTAYWLEEFGISNKNIAGKFLLDIIPNIPPNFLKMLKNSFGIEGKLEKEFKHILPDSSIRWYKWNIKPWKQKNRTYGGFIITNTDITKAKRVKELLIAAENVAKMGGWDLDMITNTIHWSKITKEIHEVPSDYIPTLETAINFLKEGEHRETIIKCIQNATTKGLSWDLELQIITEKGNEVWLRSKGMPEFVNGKCVRLYGIYQNIDKKKKTEIKNAQIKERLDMATAVAKIGIWELDFLKDSLEWNNEMYDLYHLKRKDFILAYDRWKAMVHPNDQERFQHEFELAVAGVRDFNTEFRVVCPNGSIKYIRANTGVFKNEDGKPIKMIGTNWDITDQVNTQLKLDKSEESFKGSFKSSAVGMALVAKNGSWLDVNNSLCTSLGYTRKELLKLTFQDITHPDDINNDLNHLQPLLDGQGNSYQIEKRYIHKKGHLVYGVLTVTAVKDIEGKLSHFISQIVDISTRIETKKKSEKLLEITKNQNSSLLNFAHIVSHNLRSHSSNLSMLSNYLTQEEDEEEKKTIEKMIKDASESLNETVVHLNDVVQITTGAKGQLREVNLKNTIKNVEKNISALLSKKKGSCSIVVDPSVKVMVVPAYLDSILLNLFTNSIKYSSPKRPPKITISSQRKGETVVFDFKDNGLGINLERHGKKLFGMYKTFHQHEDARGIGLFITKNQVEAMDGKIEVESVVDKGTTFRVTLVSG